MAICRDVRTDKDDRQEAMRFGLWGSWFDVVEGGAWAHRSKAVSGHVLIGIANGDQGCAPLMEGARILRLYTGTSIESIRKKLTT